LNTEIIKISATDGSEKYNEAVELLKNNQVVGMPTETVYGLAGNAYSEEAVKRIFEAKGRPQDNPLIVHISEFSEIYDLVSEVPEIAKKLAKKFWPGPLTMILPKSEKVPSCVTAGLDSVAVRCPSHPVARNLIKYCGLPIAAPSANISGKPSPTKAEHVFSDLNGKIPLVIDGGESEEGVESTVISLCGDVPKLLRPGNVTLRELESICGEVLVDDAVLNPLKEGEKVSSPGMKYKHYSPEADVTVIEGDMKAVKKKIDELLKENTDKICGVLTMSENAYDSAIILSGGVTNRDYANKLFAHLREFDRLGVEVVFAEFESRDGYGLAIKNRLYKAAGQKVIYV
jgi:L-threonylcarbamoyladenylate synthase